MSGMTNTLLLKDTIDESGMTMTAIAQKSELTRETLYNKVNGKTEFTASEILKIRKVLGLTKKQQEEIFFCEKM